MKIATVVGARPQFVKAAAVSRAIRDRNTSVEQNLIHEIIIHTGQHFDNNMSQIFFDEMEIPVPDYNLCVAGGTHAAMTGRMLDKIESVLMDLRPECVLVYGDTNSTLAGALAAIKLHIPIAHVEAGLRSFNMRMPEEINRILTDRISTLLFCPTSTAVTNLKGEGITSGVHLVGDVMYDAALHYSAHARTQSSILQQCGVMEGQYALATIHRAENTNDPERIKSILSGFGKVSERMPMILPLHPRTRKRINELDLGNMLGDIKVINPVSFIDMVRLEQSAAVIITDSGGVQKEAYFAGVPCITLRDETEWTETVDSRWNTLVGTDSDKLICAVESAVTLHPSRSNEKLYGDGNAARKIIELLLKIVE